MNVSIPKSFGQLPRVEREKITEYCREVASRAVNDEEADLQIIWMKLCCILLHETFGFGERRLYLFLGNWKRIYKRNARIKTKAEQADYLAGEMAKIFKKSGFPAQFVESLKNI